MLNFQFLFQRFIFFPANFFYFYGNNINTCHIYQKRTPMKSKTRILIAVIVLLIAGIITFISTMYKPAGSDLTTGSFGKADKYHKQPMTEKDVQLRSKFVEDTLLLRNMIQGLRYFTLFNEKVTSQIDTALASLRYHPLLSDQGLNPPFIALKEYSAFLASNSSSISSTEIMLRQFCSGQEAPDQSVDVEKNLRDLGNFLNQVAIRDSVLEEAAMSIDRYLDKAGKKKLMYEEISDLKNFRDQLLVDNILTAAMLGEKSTLSRLARYVKDEDDGSDLIASAGTFNIKTQEVLALGSIGFIPEILSVETINVISIEQAVNIFNSLSVQQVAGVLCTTSSGVIPLNMLDQQVAGVLCTTSSGVIPLNMLDGVYSIKNQLQELGCLNNWNFLY
jgi:hypothetical protein